LFNHILKELKTRSFEAKPQKLRQHKASLDTNPVHPWCC